jgi:uncharacterized membrane protein HdeD (DUF308 family)
MNPTRTHVLNFIGAGLLVLGLLFVAYPGLHLVAACLFLGSFTLNVLAMVLFALDIRRLDREPVWTGRRR